MPKHPKHLLHSNKHHSCSTSGGQRQYEPPFSIRVALGQHLKVNSGGNALVWELLTDSEIQTEIKIEHLETSSNLVLPWHFWKYNAIPVQHSTKTLRLSLSVDFQRSWLHLMSTGLQGIRHLKHPKGWLLATNWNLGNHNKATYRCQRRGNGSDILHDQPSLPEVWSV